MACDYRYRCGFRYGEDGEPTAPAVRINDRPTATDRPTAYYTSIDNRNVCSIVLEG